MNPADTDVSQDRPWNDESPEASAGSPVLPTAPRLDDEANGWMAAVAAALASPEVYVTCPVNDLGGHELALLDFDPATADRLRRLGRLIEIPDADGVRTALAISGSSAQSRVHPYPADADFFERVHLRAPDRRTAALDLAHLVRTNALRAAESPALRLVEVHFGRQPGTYGAIRWSPTEVKSGVALRRSGGADQAIGWDEAASDPGFVKLDWLLVDPSLGGPGKVSKVVDGTWEGPDGKVESLDGLIDGDFQQIYLSAADALTAARLVEHAGADLGLATYLRFMELEIVTYLRQEPPDYVKIAKRLYNRCRLTGHFAEALWLRERFDESSVRMAQVRARLESLTHRVADDPAAAIREVRYLIGADGRVATAVEEVSVVLATDAPLCPDTVAVAIAGLDAALADSIARDFGRRLRSSSAIDALLDEIEQAVAAAPISPDGLERDRLFSNRG